MKRHNGKWVGGLAAAAAGLVMAMPAHASLIDHGITYTLTESSTANPLIDQFTLSITGINGLSDDEGGRYGVQSFAFNQPAGFVSATPPSGFSFELGGLSNAGGSGGCDNTGNFFCFSANTTPTGPALAAGSSLSFDFTIEASSFANYDPGFKINWVGTNRNYDLVSLPLAPDSTPPTNVPEPTTLALFGAALAGLAIAKRRKRS